MFVYSGWYRFDRGAVNDIAIQQAIWASLIWAGSIWAAPAIAQDPDSATCILDAPEINESSGLASSRSKDWLYTHNDSGDTARFFAVDRAGKKCGAWTIPSVKALDWEDMAAFSWEGQSVLLLADVGDNRQTRERYQLHIVSEPSSPRDKVQLLRTVQFHYPDGCHDCEAVAVDEAGGAILLIVKQWPLRSHVFQVDLPAASHPWQEVEARHLGYLPIPLITGADISTTGDRLAVTNYTSVFLYDRRDGEAWSAVFKRPPVRVEAPGRRQGEAICFADHDQILYLTSEQRPTPLIRLGPLPRRFAPPASPAD